MDLNAPTQNNAGAPTESILTPSAVPAINPVAHPAVTPSSVLPLVAPPPAVNYRKFGDSAGTRQRIFDRVLEEAQKIEPVANPRHSLEFADLKWAGPEDYSIAEQKKAILSRGTLSRRLTGTALLKDALGNVLAKKNTQLAKVPFMTNRGTFILKGTEYTMAHQMRLRPGVFTRRKDNGELECFHRDTLVWTEHGDMPIGDIVKNRLNIRVWSYDFDASQFVLRRVTNWMKNPVKKGMGKASFRLDSLAPASRNAHPRQTTWVTPSHEFLTRDGGKVPVSQLTEFLAVEDRPSDTQEQLLLGSLLGDGCVGAGGIFEEGHGEKQRKYLQLKADILGALCSAPLYNGSNRNGYGDTPVVYLRTKTWAYLRELRFLCYPDGKKQVSREWLDKIDARGLAFWFCDDGSSSRAKNQHGQTSCAAVTLATDGFSRKCIDTLLLWLQQRWGIYAGTTRNSKSYGNRDLGWAVCITGDDAENFLDLVAPYIMKSLQYKLGPRPIAATCRTCGCEIAPRRRYCNKCTLTACTATAPEDFDKPQWVYRQLRRQVAIGRFGDSQTVDTLLQSGEMPPEESRGFRWDQREAAAGSKISELLADTAHTQRLRSVPYDYETDPEKLDARCKSRFAYDITVEGTHNYFANGMLVGNSHVNVKKGYGHRIFLDPESGIFRIQMGQARIPLMPLLKTMGVSDKTLRDTWGNDLAAVNMGKSDPQAISKIYKKLYKNGDDTGEEQHAAVVKAFNEMELDPEVTKRTLGQPYKNVGADTLMGVTKKLLDVSRGDDEPDDRDAMAYQTLLGPEDLISERITKAKNVARQLLWKASAKGHLDNMKSGAYDDSIKAAIMSSGLGIPLEEINPADIFDQQARVTRMGEGGIPSLDAVPDEARSVQPSQFGFIDFLRTPECYDYQTEVMTRQGWKRWPDVVATDELACQVDGRLCYCHPHALHRYRYHGQLHGVDTGRINYLVTPNHRVWVRGFHKTAEYHFENADSVKNFRKVQSGGFLPYLGDAAEVFRLPRTEISHNPKQVARATNIVNIDTINIDDWAEFMGWWLGEGSSACRQSNGDGRVAYRARISQSLNKNPENYTQIEQLLDRLPFKWCKDARGFTIGVKQLAVYLQQFRGSPERYIPEELLRSRVSAREKLFDALMRGEGRRDRRGVRTQFCTTSPQLSTDFQRLAFSLGYATTHAWEPDERAQSNYGGAHVIHVHKFNEHQIHTKRPPSQGGHGDHYQQQYNDNVYCATVPGGLLYVRRNNCVGHWSGNSGKVGVDARLARGAMKGSDGRVYSPVNQATDGKLVYKSPQDLADAVLAFPNSLQKNTPYVPALSGGKVRMVPRASVDFEVPDMEGTFSSLGNMIPLKSMVKGQRAVMAARMLTQAMPVQGAEAPLVQSGVPGQPGKSFEEEYSTHMGALRAEAPGRVVSIDNERIVMADEQGKKTDIQLYNNFPYNRKTFVHQTPTVQVGDVVQPGQLLARSNFTDDKGTTALGRNARVAYVPWGGLNFEDANVISASFAKKMSSEHMYQNAHEWEDTDKRGKNAYISLFPSTYSKKMLEYFDDDGIIKPGTKVSQDDPLILVGGRKEMNKKSLLKGGKPIYQDKSELWEHERPGIVTDVVKSDKGVAVVVKSIMPMQEGDKLSGRYGDKGIISRIVPDDEMPRLADGQPAEVLLNPLGITSRTNPAQIVEAALGKIAAARGEPFKIPDFQDEEDLVEYALKEMQKAGFSDTESIIDPTNDRKINDVFTGNRWFMKLHHTSESKGQGRGLGTYTAEMTPAKGGSEGAKRIGMLETNALLSHGATEVLRDSKLVRGQANPQYWSQYMSGFKPATPQIPHVYHKFVNNLRAAGINVIRDGNKTHIMAMTNKDVDKMAGDRELQNVETVNWKNMEPIAGGLFDPKLTGGHASSDGGGNRWSYIKLQEPMPNPVMEEPIRRLLDLTRNKFTDIISGKETLNGATGPAAIATALKNINVTKELAQAREEIKSGKKTARDRAVRRLGYLKSAERLNISPADWVLTKVPVLPPSFRPVSVMGEKKLPLVADPNYLYKELWDSNKTLKDLTGQLDAEDLGDERLATYNAFKAVTGLGDPTNPKNQERNVKGILKHVFGSSPKLGSVQRRLLGSTTDLVGRAVIAPDPDLDMDQVGLPENQAWTIYTPVLVRQLVRRGMSRQQAARAVEERSSPARQALLNEMDNGVVIINRAPTLHKYGVMASRPKLVKGDVLKVSPLVVGGFGADFDGDAMQYHLPITEAAKEEALEKMLPSRNLISAGSFQAHFLPSQEYVGGLYEASARTDKNSKPQVFATKADAIKAYKQGRIGPGRRVEILN